MPRKSNHGNGKHPAESAIVGEIGNVDKPVEKAVGQLTNPGRNGGRLRRGALPGTNRGGSGRPPSVVRKICMLAFEQRIPALIAIADGEAIQKIQIKGADGQVEATVSATPKDRITAIDVLGKYGLGTKNEVSGDPDNPLTVRYTHIVKAAIAYGEHTDEQG